MAEKQLRGTLCTLVGGICWGLSGCCGQYLFSMGINSKWLTAVRLLSSGIILLVLAAFTQKKKLTGVWREKRDVLRILAFGVFGLMLCQYTYLTAINCTNAATATVLQYLGPVLVMLVMCLIELKLPGKRDVLAVVLAVGGTFLIATHGEIGSLVLSREGFLWCMGAALSVVLYTLLPGNLTAKWGTVTVNGIAMTAGGIVLALLFRVWNYDVALNFNIVMGLGGIVIFGTVIAFSLYIQGVSDIGPVKASIIASVEPVSSAVISFLWLGTSFKAIDILGFAMVLSTVFLLTRGGESKQ